MNADKDRDDVYPGLGHAIIGAAMRVLNVLKPGRNFNENPVAQMLGYLAITGFQLALLLNFEPARVCL